MDLYLDRECQKSAIPMHQGRTLYAIEEEAMLSTRMNQFSNLTIKEREALLNSQHERTVSSIRTNQYFREEVRRKRILLEGKEVMEIKNG